MGIGTNALKREIGKNTGKWISNKVFGDGHSTPYRRVGSTSTPRQYVEREYVAPRPPRISKTEMRHNELMEQLEAENNLKERMYEEQQEIKKKQLQREFITQMQQNIKSSLHFIVDKSEDTIQDDLNELISILETKNWHEKKKNEWIDSFEKDKNRLDNQLADIYFGKLKDGIKALSSSSVSLEQQKSYRNLFFKLKKRRLSSIYGTWGLVWLYISTFFSWLFKLIFVHSQKKTNTSNTIPVEQIKQVEKTEELTQIEEDIYFDNSEESIFIDLNENQRIENCLSSIWSKYQNSVDKGIINRKPIFSSDAVKNSILYIGVNPSYNALDDSLLIPSEDKKSLLYGSLYQIPDAPDYFKALELFAAQMNVGYTHINLLYARENDRDLLLNCDHNFIREQLELTYDTIIKAKPVAIIFFSDYCKDLIFGEERWVSPLKNSDGHYILNGTTIPVIFTDDITILTENEKEELKKNIQKII